MKIQITRTSYFSHDTYRKVASSNTSRLEAHAGFFRLLIKGICDPLISKLVTRVRTRDNTVTQSIHINIFLIRGQIFF